MIGIEEKDMIINRIPAKTWNHLHMNQSRVGEVVINRTGELNASVNDVSLIDDGKLNNGELDNIIGGDIINKCCLTAYPLNLDKTDN